MNKTIINPSEIGKQLAIPQIRVIEDGKEVVRPDVIQAVTQLASLGQLARIRRSLEKEEFQGVVDPRTLNATEKRRKIKLLEAGAGIPWATASFFNDGPDAVHIVINNSYPAEAIDNGETINVDFTKADRRIEIISYWCDAGETASVRVVGKY